MASLLIPGRNSFPGPPPATRLRSGPATATRPVLRRPWFHVRREFSWAVPLVPVPRTPGFVSGRASGSPGHVRRDPSRAVPLVHHPAPGVLSRCCHVHANTPSHQPPDRPSKRDRSPSGQPPDSEELRSREPDTAGFLKALAVIFQKLLSFPNPLDEFAQVPLEFLNLLDEASRKSLVF